MAKIALYTDKPENTTEDLGAVRKYFEADSPVFLNVKPVGDFDSGISWKTMADRGITAVVLHNVSRARAFGVYLEAETSGVKVYEMFGDELFELSCLKMPVTNFKKTKLV